MPAKTEARIGTLPDDALTAARRLLGDHMALTKGESVLVTADTASDPAAIEALMNAAALLGGQPVVAVMAPLPFQGTLADPFIPKSIAAAAEACDVWIDLCFPYVAGSHMHDHAVRKGGVRFLLASGLSADGIARIYGADLDRLYKVQSALDRMAAEAIGAECRITSRAGSDVAFVMGKPGYLKPRQAKKTGSYTPPGSAVFFPDPESVRGKIVIETVFHEYYVQLRKPVEIEIDGRIRSLSGGGNESRVMDRALKRAGGGDYGYVIHFTHGFHSGARAGDSLIEDIRVVGNDSAGLGLPWWAPGGGENHPDGILTMQTVVIDGTEVVRDGIWLGRA